MIIKDVWNVDMNAINKYQNVVKAKFGVMNRDVYVCWNDKDELLKNIKPINKDEITGKVLKKYMAMNYDGNNISINLDQMLGVIHMTIEAVEDICKKR